MSNSVESHTHSIIHWAYFFLLLSGSECPANGEQRRGKRERGMERQEEERMRAYIKAVPSDICALGVERHYEYQYEPMERKHSLFFLLFLLTGLFMHTRNLFKSMKRPISEPVRDCVSGAAPALDLMSVALY